MARLLLVAVPSLLLALSGTSHAQRFTGELSGTVVDETGAVIPGADVTLTNEASGSARRTITNADGFFAFSAVPAATYTLAVQISGFKTHEIKGIPLRSGDSRSLRTIKLEVAAMAETVSVSAEVALTPLNSGERSATLTSEVIQNIPIVSSSAAELLRILPGLTPVSSGATNRPGFTGEVIGINGNGEYQGGGSNNQSAIGNFSANGTRTQSLDITLDGAPGADPGCNCATSVNPNTEFVQEFKVLQSSFSAEYAKGPNAMQVVTKSGGRAFHGSLFTYFRDYHLNSNEWFANKIERERVKNKFVYPGFTFSGPLTFGNFNKNRDKVFFFVGYEYYDQRLDTGFVRSWTPTQRMRNGDFGELLGGNQGLTGGFVNTPPAGFPDGMIPSNQIDSGGGVLLNLFPLPNADARQTGGWNYVDNLLVDQPNHQALARLDFNISDSTKLFLRYNLQRETQPFVIGLWWRNGARQVPYPSSISAPNQSDSATVSLTHVFDPTLTSETIFGVTYIDFPNQIDDRSKVSRQALGYPYGGVFGEDDLIPSVDLGAWGDNGPLYFNPGGFDPVLFATKWQFNAAENLTKVWGTHTAKFGLYFERITNNQPGNGNSNGFLILNRNAGNSTGNTFADLLLGRGITHYDQQTRNALHNIAWNRWEAYAQDSWKVKPSFTLSYGVRASILEPWTDREGNGFAAWDQSRYSAAAPGSDFPGVVWNRRDPSVPLTAVGTSLLVQPRIGFAWDLRGTGETVLRGGAGLYYYHDAQGPFAGLIDIGAGVRSFSRDADAGLTLRQFEGLGGGGVVFGGDTIDITDDKQPKTYSWSLTVNQKLPWSMNVEVGYVGNSSQNLMNFDVANFNMVRPDGTRPLPQYGDLDVFRHSMEQNYHGLQTLLARQRGGLNFTVAYTFSKALGFRSGIGGNQSVASEYVFPNFRDIAYGILSYDRTHVATASYSWLIPGPQEGVGKAVLGGWQIAGISSYVSGAPLPIVNNSNFDMQGTLAGGQSISNQLITGSSQIRAQPLLTCDPRDDVPSGYIFNPACFAAPSPGQNGNYVLPYIQGQAYVNHDLSLLKNFDLGGERKLQFRVSAYNVFNHPIRFPDNGQNLTLRFTNGQLSDPNFGRLPEDNKFGRRIVQLALRFSF